MYSANTKNYIRNNHGVFYLTWFFKMMRILLSLFSFHFLYVSALWTNRKENDPKKITYLTTV